LRAGCSAQVPQRIGLCLSTLAQPLDYARQVSLPGQGAGFLRKVACVVYIPSDAHDTRKASTVGTRNVVEPCLRAVESSASACSDPCHNGDHGCSAQTEEEIMSRCRAGNVAASVFVDIGSAVRCTGKTGRRPQIMG